MTSALSIPSLSIPSLTIPSLTKPVSPWSHADEARK